MATASRIYLVTNHFTKEQHLVRATHPSTAVRHVVKDAVDATVATQDELVRLMSAGVKPQDATEEEG